MPHQILQSNDPLQVCQRPDVRVERVNAAVARRTSPTRFEPIFGHQGVQLRSPNHPSNHLGQVLLGRDGSLRHELAGRRLRGQPHRKLSTSFFPLSVMLLKPYIA